MKWQRSVVGLFAVFAVSAIGFAGFSVAQDAESDESKTDESAKEAASSGSSELLANADAKAGQRIYMKECVSCHKADGSGGEKPTASGNPSPNMRDPEFWVDRSDGDNVRVITEGIPNSGMVAMEGVLTEKEIHDVAAYLRYRYEPRRKSRAATVKAASEDADGDAGEGVDKDDEGEGDPDEGAEEPEGGVEGDAGREDSS